MSSCFGVCFIGFVEVVSGVVLLVVWLGVCYGIKIIVFMVVLFVIG